MVGEELHGRGSMLGRGGGSAGRTRRSRGTWAGSERVRRVRSSSRVSRSNYIDTAGSIRIPTRQSASRVDAVDTWPPTRRSRPGRSPARTTTADASRGRGNAHQGLAPLRHAAPVSSLRCGPLRCGTTKAKRYAASSLASTVATDHGGMPRVLAAETTIDPTRPLGQRPRQRPQPHRHKHTSYTWRARRRLLRLRRGCCRRGCPSHARRHKMAGRLR